MRSLSRRFIQSGYRTRGRDTFFCSAKRKYPKKRRLDCRCFLRSSVLSGAGREGFLPSYRRAASMARPFGLIPTKPAVLGAANESNTPLLLFNVSKAIKASKRFGRGCKPRMASGSSPLRHFNGNTLSFGEQLLAISFCFLLLI